MYCVQRYQQQIKAWHTMWVPNKRRANQTCAELKTVRGFSRIKIARCIA